MSAAPRRSCSPFDAAGVVGVAGRAGVAGAPSLAGVLSRASVPSRAGVAGVAGVVGVAALIRTQTTYSERGCPAHTRLHRATTNRNLARRATPGRLPAQPPLSGPHPAAQRGVCTIRCIATACRRRVAALMLQFPHTPPQPRPRPSPATANPATASDQPVARHHRRKLRAPPAIQTKRNQTNSLRSNCHKLMFNALEFIHEPRR